MNTKIRNQKITATLGQDAFITDLSGEKVVYKKGKSFYDVSCGSIYQNDGIVVVQGHGVSETIGPKEAFTKFTQSWDEVTTNKNKDGSVTTTKIHKKKDITKDIQTWWKELEQKDNKKSNTYERGIIRSTLATLRRQLKEAKNGTTEREIAECEQKLKTLS